MSLVTKPDFNLIFASQAPSQDTPPQFNNYVRGMDETRKNNGKPTIKQFNYLHQNLDLKLLWILQNGAALPYDSSIEYAENSLALKDGDLQQFVGGTWSPFKRTVDASDVKDESGKTQQDLNTAIFKNTYYAELEGFVGDGSTDNFAVWQTLSSKLNDGDSIVFKDGDFYYSQPISIDKVVSVQGMLRSQAIGTVFKFTGTSGVTRNSQYSSLENIAISGTKTSTVLDFDNRVFGTVGLKEAYSGAGARSSGGILRNVSVVGFDVNRLSAQENSEVWAGAYRENYNVLLRAGRFGYVALDGATHEKFYGGVISANTEGGVYSKATKIVGAGDEAYNNIELHGTTMEVNGKQDADFVGDATDFYVNIYSEGKSAVKLYGAYNEHVNNYAKNGGAIEYFGAYQHGNVKNFANGGQIIDYSSHAPYSNKLVFDGKLARLFTANTGATTASISIASNTMQVSSTTNGVVQIATPTINVRSIKNKELRAIKVAYQYRFTGGYTANTQLLIQPLMRAISATASRADGNVINRSFPTQILINPYNQVQSFEFYYFPRFGTTTYLDAEGILSAIQLILQVKNGAADPNFSTDALSLEVDSVTIELLTDVAIPLRYELAKSGTTASRPSLSIFEQGYVYYDTTLGRNVTWDGSTWVEKQALIESSNTAAMSSLANSINTTSKYMRLVYNTTNGKMYYPMNTTAAAAWRPTDNSGDITPV